ncbi:MULTISPECIES: hypothetical protein [unclassified Rhizobium]|uniref:hypothetical protein n=1 Tax=unclassified Rhizobium TaxID=2613769 RepID=UPI0006F49581|nr:MULTISPECIES: hypothetical protein [unclassified Rhizobium]KQV35541.1 hypothetical protein ASC86_09975 [Rhizobium sp. Root1212]KRD25647.1 hypothetical protein ASE37_09970 [Rhizobium sp. Root268]
MLHLHLLSLAYLIVPAQAYPLRTALMERTRKVAFQIKGARERGDLARTAALSRVARPLCGKCLDVAREVAKAESALGNWGASARAWKVACSHAHDVSYKDWIQFAIALNNSGNLEAAIATLERAEKKFAAHEVKKRRKEFSALRRLDVRTLAHRDACHSVIYYKQKEPADTVVLTFGTVSSGLGSTPFAYPFLVDSGFDHIHVAQEKHTFYQSLSLSEFVTVVSDACRGKRVIAYGSSLGGYGAIYFGGAVDAQIIAASPVNYLDKVIFRKRWAKIPMLHGIIAENPISSKAPVIFYDPLDDERDRIYLSSRVLPAYPNAVVVPLPGAGHEVFRELQKRGILKRTILAIIAGDPWDV